MTVTFFQDFPIPPSAPRPPSTRFVPPAWSAPPAYELPVVVHLGQFLHRSPRMVVAVRSAEVYSTGCSFNLSWVFRRGDENEDDWADKHSLFFQPGMGIRRGTRLLSGLMLGVELADGSKASTGAQGPHGFMGSSTEEPEPPTLALNGGGGSGADNIRGGDGNDTMLAQWMDFGLAESSVVLDGGKLRDAAAGVQQFWADGDQP